MKIYHFNFLLQLNFPTTRLDKQVLQELIELILIQLAKLKYQEDVYLIHL
jgi:hypothetical protein